jgi:hypothetical protein
MSPLELTLFVLLFVTTGTWFFCLARLSRYLRERHRDAYDELDLANLFPLELSEWLRGFSNASQVWALLKFLFGGHFWKLRDPQVNRVAMLMRQVLIAHTIVFVVFAGIIIKESFAAEDERREIAASRKAIAASAAAAAPAAADVPVVSEAEAAKRRAIQNWRRDDLNAALQDFREVIRIEPANFEAHRHADRILSQQQRWDEVIALWEPYLALEPRNADAYLERGGAHYHKGDMTAAKEDVALACSLGSARGCKLAERFDN